MPYAILLPSDKRSKQFNKVSITALGKMRKYKIAQQESRTSYKLRLKIMEQNYHNQIVVSKNLIEFQQMLYGVCRSKINDTSTPIGEKRAYRTMAAIMEKRYGRDYLVRENPFFLSKSQTHKLCWIPHRQSYKDTHALQTIVSDTRLS